MFHLFYSNETLAFFSYLPLSDGALLAAVVHAHLHELLAIGSVRNEISLGVNLVERGIGGAIKLQFHDVDHRRQRYHHISPAMRALLLHLNKRAKE